MAEWIMDQKNYKLSSLNGGYETKVSVSGVMDDSESERRKLVLADHPDNKGPSVMNEATRSSCIASISDGLNIDPSQADWFAEDENGRLHAVSVEHERLKVEDPQFTQLKTNGEFNIHDVDEAKKSFPDVEVERMRTPLSDVEPEQRQSLDAAFDQAQYHRENEQAQQVAEPAIAPGQEMSKSAQEYDLSQESMWDR